MATIADLIMRQGEIAARGAERSGEIWGNAVQQLGQIGAGAFQQYAAQKEEKKRMAMFDEAMASFDPQNPMDFYRKASVAVGPELANQSIRAFAALAETQKRNQPDPKLFAEQARFLKTMSKANPEWLPAHWSEVYGAVAPQAKALYGVDLSPEWSEDYRGMLDAFNPDDPTGQGFTLGPDQVRFDASGNQIATGPPKPVEVKPPATQNIGGKVMQFNTETGRYDIPLGASEAALNREAAGAARAVAAEERAVASAEKKAEKEREAGEAKRANDDQVASAFAAMKAALGEVEKYSGTGAVTSPLEAANARQQYSSAANAFAATLSRATGDTRISDLDRKAYAGLLNYTGPGKSLLMITRPDLTRKRLEEAEKFFEAASGARGGGKNTPPKPPASNSEKSALLKKYGF